MGICTKQSLKRRDEAKALLKDLFNRTIRNCYSNDEFENHLSDFNKAISTMKLPRWASGYIEGYKECLQDRLQAHFELVHFDGFTWRTKEEITDHSKVTRSAYIWKSSKPNFKFFQVWGVGEKQRA